MTVIISDKQKFIFIHVIKTAGTSIREAITPNIKEHTIMSGHHSIKEIWKDKYKDYFKFAFIRNPWDRMVSNYFYFRRTNKSKHWFTKAFNSCDEFLNGFDKFDKFQAIYPQSYWLENENGDVKTEYLSSEDGNIKMDFIGKFENLQNDFDYICNKINVPLTKLPHMKETNYKHYSTYYNDKSIEKVANFYKKEIELGDYKFERKI